jgi:hypothetical protein
MFGFSSGAFVGAGYSLSGEGGSPVVKNENEKAIKHRLKFNFVHFSRKQY